MSGSRPGLWVLRLPAVLAVSVTLTLLAPVLPAAAASCDPNDGLCGQLSDAKNQQADVQTRLAAIDKNIQEVQARAGAIQRIILDFNAQIAQQQAAIAATRTQIDAIDRQVRFTEADISRRQAHMEVKQALLNRKVRTMDKQGSLDYLELILTARSFNQMIDRVMLTQAIVRSDQKILFDLRSERDQVKELQVQLEAQRQQKAGLLVQQQAQQATLLKLRADQQTAFDALKVLQAELDTERRTLEAQQAEINALVLVLQQEYDAAARAAGGGTGQFGWPENYHLITQPFGCSDLLGEPYSATCSTHHWHTGIDIGGPSGAPIYAADSGIVSFVGGNPRIGYGNYVIITHGNGYSTLYGHMSGFAVTSRSVIRRGAVIGYEGSTGYSTGAHLHFEIRLDGDYKNPCAWLGCV